jgi:hypothetical protein
VRGRGRILVRAAGLACLGLWVAGCMLFAGYPAPPEERLIPTIAGVVASLTPDLESFVLTDGRTLATGYGHADVAFHGFDPGPGNLVLARTTDPKFVWGVEPITDRDPGCWDPWTTEPRDPLVWDLGDSVLFPGGLQLTKAPAYHNYVPQEQIDGRTVWRYEPGDAEIGFCVGASGEVEWVRKQAIP